MTETTQDEAQAAPAKPEQPNLEELFPKDTLVVLTKTDFKGHQGRVVGHIEKLGTRYLEVAREVLASGKRLTEPKTMAVRHTSVDTIDAYRDEPVAAPTPEPAADETEKPAAKGKAK